MRFGSFERLAGACAIGVGALGLLYSVTYFIFLQSDETWADTLRQLFLMVAGLLSTFVFVAVYERLRQTDAAFALLVLVLGLAGAIGSAIHGTYELAKIIEPPTIEPDLPNPVDPRGFMTFGVAGLALFLAAWLIVRGGQFPLRLGYLAFVAGLLLVVLFLGRLIIVDPENPLLVVVAVLAGLLASPALYFWLGRELMRTGASSPS